MPAALSEQFWSGSSWAEVGENATHYWVGSAPRLAVPDGDTGYARMLSGDPYVTVMVTPLPAFSYNPAAGSVTVSTQVRFNGTWPSGTEVTIGLSPDFAAFVGGAFDTFYGIPLGEWVTLTLTIPAEDAADVLEYAQAGTLVAFALAGDLVDAEAWDCSWLSVSVGTPRLRQRNRGTIRQRNQAARQTSLRQRGFL